MATYRLSIYVNDIDVIFGLFDQIRVYRSTTGQTADRVILSTIALVAGQSSYEYLDTQGLSTYVAWFTYYNSVNGSESGFSEPIEYGSLTPGYAPGFYFQGSTYPDEYGLTYDESVIIDSIRHYIGDLKEVKRDYVNPDNESLYSNVSVDGTVYRLSDPPGWPLKVILDGYEYTNVAEPLVHGYEYITFSGSTISTLSGVLEVWYEKFRHSDREILHLYYTLEYPSPLTSDNVTTEIRKVSTAVALLEAELRELTGSVDGSFAVAGDIRFDPSSILRARKQDLENLRKKLDDLVDEASQAGLYGLSGVRLE